MKVEGIEKVNEDWADRGVVGYCVVDADHEAVRPKERLGVTVGGMFSIPGFSIEARRVLSV